MQVSIIIVNYNTFAFTCAAIQSVISRSEAISYEIIVVDNASTECPAERFKEEFPLIELIKNPTNQGFAKGNNLGIAQAKGQYIVLLNSDAELKNNAIDIAMQKLEQQPQIGVLSAELTYPNGRLQYPAQRFDTLVGELRELFRLNKSLSAKQRGLYYLGNAYHHLHETECDWVWGAFFMFRSSLLAQLPEQKLADTFFMYAEDVQWCYQIKRLGYKVWYYPEAKVVHHLGGSDRKGQAEDDKYFSRLLPNRYKLLQLEKGRVYAFCTYAVRALHLLTLRTADNRAKARRYMRLLF